MGPVPLMAKKNTFLTVLTQNLGSVSLPRPAAAKDLEKSSLDCGDLIDRSQSLVEIRLLGMLSINCSDKNAVA